MSDCCVFPESRHFLNCLLTYTLRNTHKLTFLSVNLWVFLVLRKIHSTHAELIQSCKETQIATSWSAVLDSVEWRSREVIHLDPQWRSTCSYRLFGKWGYCMQRNLSWAYLLLLPAQRASRPPCSWVIMLRYTSFLSLTLVTLLDLSCKSNQELPCLVQKEDTGFYDLTWKVRSFTKKLLKIIY